METILGDNIGTTMGYIGTTIGTLRDYHKP